MVKKITKEKDSITLEIDKTMADALGINKKTDLEMIVVNKTLIIRPKNKKTSEEHKKFEETTSRLLDKYGPVLKKLAKT